MANSYNRVLLKDHHWELANKRVESSMVYKLSHRGEEANQVGFLGEIVFEEFLKKNGIKFIDDRIKTTHDYVINSLTVDLKTKDRTVRPKKHYDNSVPKYNHEHQRPKYYYFISLLRDKNNKSKKINRFTEAFLMRGIDIQTLEKKGKHWRKGEIDPSNNTKFWTDCINVGMDLLIDNKKMLAIFTHKH